MEVKLILKRILFIFGTRPEAIKLAPLIIEMKKHHDVFSIKICVTGQHRQMLDEVLMQFDIKPDIDLNIMKSSQDLTDVTTSVLFSLREIFIDEEPDLVIVHGDTSTAFASALACFYRNIPVVHVEAGLRTNQIDSPFPEELNRQVISRIARFHFAPTNLSKSNLINEMVDESKIAVTGNTVVDSLLMTLLKIDNNPSLALELNTALDELLGFNWRETKYILITGHRRENFGDGFKEICQSLKILSSSYPKIHFVYPVHLNPNVQGPVYEYLKDLHNVHLIKPLDYLHFVQLMRHCYLVLTDSGGMQEEAPSLGKPVLVMRDSTERPEGVTAGTVRLVGANSANIVAGIEQLLENKEHYASMANAHNPYGDGMAAKKITQILRGFDYESL